MEESVDREAGGRAWVAAWDSAEGHARTRWGQKHTRETYNMSGFQLMLHNISFSAYIGSLIQKKYLSYDLCFSLTYRGLHVTDVLAACTHMCPGTHWGTA